MSRTPSGNSPADTPAAEPGSAGRSLLFLCYDNPFNNTAHSICLLTMLRQLLEHGGLDGVSLHLLALNCRPDDLDRYAERRICFTDRYAGRIRVTCRTRRFPKGRLYASVLTFSNARAAVEAYVRAHGITAIYAYGETALFLVMRLARRHPRPRVLFDCRGDHFSEERVRQPLSPLPFLFRSWLARALPSVDVCFISSSALAGLLKNGGYRGRFVMNTNYADDTVFSAGERTFNREAPVFVYAGGTQHYQRLEYMLELFRTYARIRPAARLTLVLSAIDRRVSDIIDASRLDRSRLAVHTAADAAEVNRYLNGCDIAFMLREHHPLNHYAFPTKFAEYLAAGLPVISTRHVYDTARIVEDAGVGVLVDTERDAKVVAREIDGFVQGAADDMPAVCSRFARERLGWSGNVARISEEVRNTLG